MTVAKLYYEAHVTIEPVFDAAREQADILAREHSFKLAHLLMQKRELDAPERSKHDTFMTAHSRELEELIERTQSLIIALKAAGYKVWRYKIEDTVLDSRAQDTLRLL